MLQQSQCSVLEENVAFSDACGTLAVKAVYGVVFKRCSQHSPCQHADLLLQSSSGEGLHAAAGCTALGRQCDTEDGFQPQKVGDEGSFSCSGTRRSCRVLWCHFPIWKMK